MKSNAIIGAERYAQMTGAPMAVKPPSCPLPGRRDAGSGDAARGKLGVDEEVRFDRELDHRGGAAFVRSIR